MNAKVGFDNQKYLQEQADEINSRAASFKKLYLEFGGKLLYDYHASRVLPGYDPNCKMQLLSHLKDDAEILLCIYAGDIERKKIRADFGITYDADAMKLIDDMRGWGLNVTAVIITRFEGQSAAVMFKNKLERRGMRVYTHTRTNGYPTDVEKIVSDSGYGANEYVETTKPLVIVTGPGPGSGKLATCLTMLYHDYRRGLQSGYAKFETFPIWNLPLRHPVNAAYEAATADIKDHNMIDPFHLEKYGEVVVNYNRDVEVFPVLRRILEKITGKPSLYSSPTDMGVNKTGFAITDNDVVETAAKHEIIRRYFRYACEYACGVVDEDTVERVILLMNDHRLEQEDLPVVAKIRSLKADENSTSECIQSFSAIELNDGTVIDGKSSPVLGSAACLIIKAIKHLAGIPKKIDLLPRHITKSVVDLKTVALGEKSASLDVEETLIALCISAHTNSAAKVAMDKLKHLKGCNVHLTHIPSKGDEAGLRRIGVNVTSDPVFLTSDLFSG